MDLSRISHLEARQVVKAHFGSEESYDAENQATAAIREKIDIARKMIRQKEQELELAHLKPLQDELEAIEEPFREREQKRWSELEEKLKALGVDANDFQLYDGWDGVHECIVSGLPLMDGDELGETPSGDQFLFGLVPAPGDA